MKKVISIALLMIAFNCSNNPANFIEHLNGYWEIEEVTLPDGSTREYTFNGTIDFLHINDSLTGYRKKLKPSFDGSFSTSDDQETLKVMIENDSLNMYYKTPYAEWKETVLKATEKV
ncbi:MAG TPA: lipocalin family protein, partial [Aquaticitalea sp.]|nr:lipocalin family protein [Aquaticitalea sp.]